MLVIMSACHIRKALLEEDTTKKWAYYNDAKVAETTEPPVGKSFVYFFEKM